MLLTDYLDLAQADAQGSQQLDEKLIPGNLRFILHHYEYEVRCCNTSAVVANNTDERVRVLCHFSRFSPSDLRKSMRASVNWSGAENLLYFALRSAVFALRAESEEEVKSQLFEGVVAGALANLATNDPRDDISVLSKLYGAGARSGVDCLSILSESLVYCGSGVKEAIQKEFLDRSPEFLSRKRFDVVSTPCGLSITFP